MNTCFYCGLKHDGDCDMAERKNPNLLTDRFVLAVGSIGEAIGADTGSGDLILFDRQERKPVVTIHREYAQSICLETTGDSPFSALEKWFNNLTNLELESENLIPTSADLKPVELP